MLNRSYRKLSIMLCLSLLFGLLPLQTNVHASDEPTIIKPAGNLEYTFNDGTVMDWGYAWGSPCSAEGISNSTDLADGSNTGALAIDLNYTASSNFEDCNIGVFLDPIDHKVVDLTDHKKVEYDLFYPVPPVSNDTDQWVKIETAIDGGDYQDMGDWDEFNLKNVERVTIGDKQYAIIHKSVSLKDVTRRGENKRLILRLVGENLTYNGKLYIDNVVISKSSNEGFTFNDGTTMGWFGGWGSALGPVTNSSVMAVPGNEGALAINVTFDPDNGFSEANLEAWPSGKNDVKSDLSAIEKITYDVYVPNPADFTGQLKIGFAFNANWSDVSSHQAYDIAAQERVVVNGVEYAHIQRTESLANIIDKTQVGRLVIRLAGTNSGYTGPIYVDNVMLRPSEDTTITAETPKLYDQVSDAFALAYNVVVPDEVTAESVTATSASGQIVHLMKNEAGKYTGTWDTTAEPEGFQVLTANLQASDGSSSTVTTEVYVKNSPINVDIITPAFDEELGGTYDVTANVTNSEAEALNNVTLEIHGASEVYHKEFSMTLDGGVYKAAIHTADLSDGAYIFVVRAENDSFTTTDVSEAVVTNGNGVSSIVTKKGSKFALDDKTFYFNGWNTYDLAFKDNTTTSRNNKTVIYTADNERIDLFIKKDSVITYQEQIDRAMLEAKKLGATVFRTWGFFIEPENSHSYYKPDWSFNEAQFAEFDYLMESARKNGIRVIITLTNYWNDMGGIKAYTDHLGLDNKLEFFSNEEAKALYKAYIDKFTERVNSINGMKYSEDPTLFAWDLMNEPRMDKNDDNSPDKSLYDPDGAKLGAWINELAGYVKSKDSNHLVTAGSEGHGYRNPVAGNEPWARTDEGNGDNPIRVLNQPNIDFMTFHFYPNADWLKYTVEEAQGLINGFVADAHAAGKPVVMEEWNVQKNSAVRDPQNNNEEIQPGAENYDNVRLLWFKEMMKTFREAGGDGSQIWSFESNAADAGFSVTSYSPAYAAVNDRPFTLAYLDESKKLMAKSGQSFGGGTTSTPSSGNTTDSIKVVTESTLEALFGQAATDANGTKTVAVKLEKLQGNEYAVNVPVSAVAGEKGRVIHFESPLGTVVVPGNALVGTTGLEKTVTLVIKAGDPASLDAAAKSVVGNRPIIELHFMSGDKILPWNNLSSPITVSIPYSPTAEELTHPENITIFYIGEGGKATPITTGKYDAKIGTVSFTTTHFSTYAVSYVVKTFKDLSKHEWASHAIEVLAAKGIINGVAVDQFNPGQTVRRADFIVMLMKTLGLQDKADSNFSDIQEGIYYYDAVGIARKLGIVNGTGDGRFNPSAEISRQDMMVMTVRALQLTAGWQAQETDTSNLNAFKDHNQIAVYAQQAVADLVKAGLVAGKDGGIYPNGSTTRAEAAMLLYKVYNR
jgi:hypothetical protein